MLNSSSVGWPVERWTTLFVVIVLISLFWLGPVDGHSLSKRIPPRVIREYRSCPPCRAYFDTVIKRLPDELDGYEGIEPYTEVVERMGAEQSATKMDFDRNTKSKGFEFSKIEIRCIPGAEEVCQEPPFKDKFSDECQKLQMYASSSYHGWLLIRKNSSIIDKIQSMCHIVDLCFHRQLPSSEKTSDEESEAPGRRRKRYHHRPLGDRDLSQVALAFGARLARLRRDVTNTFWQPRI